MSKNSGYYVKTKSGKKGRTYHNKEMIKGKVQVFIVDDKFQETGEKLLCSNSKLTLIGYVD